MAPPVATTFASNRTIAEIALAIQVFSVFVKEIRRIGQIGTLERAGPLTAFIPTDAAFAVLPPGG
jgi:uncharacterized surface protein with fasciclin (FAS1) repeats